MLYSRQSCQVLEPFASSSLQWSIARSILLHDATKDKFSKYENWRHKLHKIARWGIFQGWWKLLSVFYTFTLRFWFVIFPRFILSATRVITGPNIVITSFSLCRHTLTFFNSLLNPVIYGWRMRQIRHAIMDSLRKVYTNRKLWFWTVRPSHSERIPFFNWHFLEFSFSFDVCWNQIGISVIWKLPMETLSNFSFLCEVSIWLCLIVWLYQILDAVRLRPTFDFVRSSMNLIRGEVRFWKIDFVKGQFCSCFRNYTISGSICWVLRFKTITYPASENCPQMCLQLNRGCH